MSEVAQPNERGQGLRLHPLSFVFLLGGTGQLAITILIGEGLFGGGLSRTALWVGALTSAFTIWAVLKARAYRYQLVGQTLLIRDGLLDRTQRHIPLARIQAVSQRRKLLHRLLGVTELVLESASGAKPEAVMRVLSLQAAARLEALLKDQLASLTTDATQIASSSTTSSLRTSGRVARLLHHLPAAEILRLGIISNRGMVVVGLAAATLLQNDSRRNEFVSYMSALVQWLVETVDAQIQSSHYIKVALEIALAVMVFMFFTRLLSVVLAFFRYHGFRLEQQGSKLMAVHGLSTQVRAAARLQRLQRWQINETWLHRRFRRCNLVVVVAGGSEPSRSSGLEPGLQLTELAPIGSWDQVQALLKTCLPSLKWNTLTWQPLQGVWVGQLWRQGRWILPVIVLLLVAPAIGYRDLSTALASALAVGLLVVWLLYMRSWVRFAAYAVEEDLLLFRSGVLHRRWVVVATSRLHTLRLHSSPLDRGLGVVSFQANAQGGSKRERSLHIPYMSRATAEALRDAIWARIGRNGSDFWPENGPPAKSQTSDLQQNSSSQPDRQGPPASL